MKETERRQRTCAKKQKVARTCGSERNREKYEFAKKEVEDPSIETEREDLSVETERDVKETERRQRTCAEGSRSTRLRVLTAIPMCTVLQYQYGYCIETLV